MVFRTTHQLGPGLEDHSDKFYWDGAGIDVSYRLGNKETGSDGHEYVMVQAGADLAASARLAVNETTWVATASAGGAFEVPAGIEGGEVANGEYFHARRFAI